MSTTDLSAWLGKSQTVVDRLDPGHAACIAVTLGRPVPELGAVLPALWHWAFFLETVPIAQTGTDGHPARGSCDLDFTHRDQTTALRGIWFAKCNRGDIGH